MYVNKVTPIADDTRKTQIKLELVSAEFIRNEKTRITKDMMEKNIRSCKATID